MPSPPPHQTDKELLIQPANRRVLKPDSPPDADEQEYDNIILDLTEEEKALQAEIDKAQLEYDKAVEEVVAAEKYYPLTEERALAQIFNEKDDTSTAYGNYYVNERNDIAEEMRETILKEETDAINIKIKEEENKLKKAQEYFALGLIPPSATNEQRLLFVDAIDNAEKEKWEGLELRRSRLDLASIHKALIKAHNQFQVKYKDEILKARYGKKVSDQWTVREEGKRWLTFGSPTNSLPRYGKIMRTYYNVGDYPEKPYDRIYYAYNYATGEWYEQYPLLGFRTPPSLDANTAEFPWHSVDPDWVFFTRDGVFPAIPWLPTWVDKWFTSPAKPEDFVAYFDSADKTVGRFNQKRAYSKCKPGYWFYETVPEEASQCVYMGHSMVDTNFSYYPASVGLSYRQYDGNDTAYYTQDYKYDKSGNRIQETISKYPDNVIQDTLPTTVEEVVPTIPPSGNEDITNVIVQGTVGVGGAKKAPPRKATN